MATEADFVTAEKGVVTELTDAAGIDFYNAGAHTIYIGDFADVAAATTGLKDNGVGIPCPSGSVVRSEPGSGEELYAISRISSMRLSKHA